MTVSTSLNKKIYTGNGTTKIFDYDYPVLSEDDLKLYLITIATGSQEEITTNFTITPSEGSFPSGSGTVTYPTSGTALSSDYKFAIIRTLAVEQPTVYPNNTSLKPKVIEKSFDRITMITQQLEEKSARALSQSIDAPSDISNTLPTPIALHSFRWDATAKNLETTLDPATVLPAAIAARDTAVSSAASALTSQTAAATSETNAATSAAAAAASAVSAEWLNGGTITGNLTVTGTLTANASSASKLATPRNINGVSFDGTANINTMHVNEVLQLRITNNATTPNLKMDITANNVPLYNTSYMQKQSGIISLTADLGVSGANGLDTGTKANSTAYFLYVIGKEDGTIASLWSLSSTTPTMPTGYIYKRRVGWNKTDSSGNIYRILQVGNKAQYIVTATTNTASLPSMASGVQGAPNTPTFVTVSTTTFVPSTATLIHVIVFNSNSANVVIVTPNANYGGSNSTTNPSPFQIWAPLNSNNFQNGWMILESGNIYYASSSSTGGLNCFGWEDAI